VTDYREKAEKWLIETPDGARALDALGRGLAALEAESAANSDKARSKAQSDALAAFDDFAAKTGATNLLRRRVLAHARDLPNGAKTDASEFKRFVDECGDTPSGRVKTRLALGRYLKDSTSALGNGLAGAAAMDFMQTSSGRYGLVTETIKSAGVDPKSGPTLPLRQKIVGAAGYTLGVESGSERAFRALWGRAARAYNESVARLRMAGHAVKKVTTGTVRDWVARDVNLGPGCPRAADLFKQAKIDGAAARERPDPSRMLSP
jgi:hypothetical protein